ncbi:MAG: DUF4870 domain-containing protein [Candidatus Micrarchaeota archaeon]
MAGKLESVKKAAKETLGKAESLVTEKTVSSEDKLWGALAYLIGLIVPVFVLLTDKKQVRFLRFHSYQSLFLSVAMVVFYIALAIVNLVLGLIAGLLALLLLPLYFLPPLAILFMVWQAFQGKPYKLPLLGDLAAKSAK